MPKQETITSQGLYPLKNKIELINDASVIIKGTVKKVLPSKWSNPDFKKGENIRNIIQTDILVDVDDVYKGTPNNTKTITVRIDEGTIGDTEMVSDDYPDFIPGEEAILFLSEDDGDLANANERYYVLTCMLQGKFSLKESEGSDKIFENANRDTLKLSAIKDEIKTTLDSLQKNPIPKMTKEEIRKQNEKVFGK